MISLLENMGVLVIPNSSVAAKAPTERERERERARLIWCCRQGLESSDFIFYFFFPFFFNFFLRTYKKKDWFFDHFFGPTFQQDFENGPWAVQGEAVRS